MREKRQGKKDGLSRQLIVEEKNGGGHERKETREERRA